MAIHSQRDEDYFRPACRPQLREKIAQRGPRRRPMNMNSKVLIVRVLYERREIVPNAFAANKDLSPTRGQADIERIVPLGQGDVFSDWILSRILSTKSRKRQEPNVNGRNEHHRQQANAGADQGDDRARLKQGSLVRKASRNPHPGSWYVTGS